MPMIKPLKLLMLIKNITFIIVIYIQINSVSANNDHKLALVIGNSNYSQAPLNNPVNDAKDMAVALKSIGFEVLLKTDLNRTDSLKILRTFSNRLNKKSIGVVYYSGHALQYNNENYLLPIDAEINTDLSQMSKNAIALSRVLEEITIAGNETNIIILDACRSHPQYTQQQGINVGLAKMSAPPGSLIAYSTTPGQVAQDGKGNNSPYTQHLKNLITTPNLLVSQLFNRVRDAVMRDTDNQQVPSEQSYLRSDFYFAGQVDSRALATLETERLLDKFRQSETKKRVASQQKQIKKQLMICHDYEKNKKFSIKTQSSVLSCYQTVLSLDPTNTTALARLSSLERRYISWTESALRHQDWDKAQAYLQVLARIHVKTSILTTLNKKLQKGIKQQQENQQIDSITDQLLDQPEPQSSGIPDSLQNYWQRQQAQLQLLPDRDFLYYLPVNINQLWLSSAIEVIDDLPDWIDFNATELSLSGHAPSDAKKIPAYLTFSAMNQAAQKKSLRLVLTLLPANSDILSLGIPLKSADKVLYEIVLRCIQAMQDLPLHIQQISKGQLLKGLQQQKLITYFPWYTNDLPKSRYLYSKMLTNSPAAYLIISKQNRQAKLFLKRFNRTLNRLQQQGVIKAIKQRYHS